jgi:phosphotransferase system HPr-like phosphotransfer protein
VKTLETELALSKDIHLRPLQAVVSAILPFKSDVVARMDGLECNAKSLLELIDTVAQAKDRSLLRFVVSGTDAEDVVAALMALATTVSEFSQDIQANS